MATNYQEWLFRRLEAIKSYTQASSILSRPRFKCVHLFNYTDSIDKTTLTLKYFSIETDSKSMTSEQWNLEHWPGQLVEEMTGANCVICKTELIFWIPQTIDLIAPLNVWTASLKMFMFLHIWINVSMCVFYVCNCAWISA